MSGMDGARASARQNAWRKIHTTCACGREVYGNGKAHQRACDAHLATFGWPVDDGMRHALLGEYSGGNGATILGAVERGLGRIYLERRQVGNKTDMGWMEFRTTFWRLAEEAADTLRRQQ